jgi:hypothetical protein
MRPPAVVLLMPGDLARRGVAAGAADVASARASALAPPSAAARTYNGSRYAVACVGSTKRGVVWRNAEVPFNRIAVLVASNVGESAAVAALAPVGVARLVLDPVEGADIRRRRGDILSQEGPAPRTTSAIPFGVYVSREVLTPPSASMPIAFPAAVTAFPKRGDVLAKPAHAHAPFFESARSKAPGGT